MNKTQLQMKIIEINQITNNDGSFLLNNYTELMDVLNNTHKSIHPKIFYFYKSFIQKILEKDDEMIKLDNEYIDNNFIFQFLFYLSTAIQDNKIVINYSYDFEFINKLYINIKAEALELKKFLLYIFLLTIIYNFNGLSNDDEEEEKEESISEKTERISEEIRETLKCQTLILKEYNLDLDFDNNDNIINVEDIYNQIIIELIRNKKLEDYDYSKNVMEQLDLENIELTNDIYEKLKDEFEQNSEKNYINCYKIGKFEDLIKEETINFYYILLKYIFKMQIYLFNIKFLFETLNNIVSIEKNNTSELFNYIINPEKLEHAKRLDYILRSFLNDKYYFFRKKSLNEILKYYRNFFFESKNEEIKAIENIKLEEKNDDYIKYLSFYDEAVKWNKRYDIIKFVFKIDNNIKEDKLNESKKNFEQYEEKIRKKGNIKKFRNYNRVLTYFINEKNKQSILKIFNQDEIDHYINDIYNNLKEIKLYYENYFCESKAKDIDIINKAINHEPEIDIVSIESKYSKDLEIAKKNNQKFDFIMKLFELKNDNKKDNQPKLEEWEKIKKALEEKNLDNLDDDKKILLFKFFNNETKTVHTEILTEESYNYLISEKNKALDEISKYYKDFFAKSRKEDIKLIKEGNIQKDIFDQYTIAKQRNIRKPLIVLFLKDKKNFDDMEIKLAFGEWEKIEDRINNKKFVEIKSDDKLKFINFLKNNNDYKIILNNIFEKNITQEFINFLKTNENNEDLNKNTILSSSVASTKLSNSSMQNKNKKKNKKKLNKHQSKQNNEFASLIIKKDISDAPTREKTAPKSEKKPQEIIKDAKNYMHKKILEKELIILLFLEQKEKTELLIKDIFYGGEFKIKEKDLNECKKYYSVNKDSIEYQLFEFLDEFQNEIKTRFISNYKLILKLKIEKIDEDFNCTYIFFPPKGYNKSFKENEIIINKLSEAFEHLIYEINDEKYKIIKEEMPLIKPLPEKNIQEHIQESEYNNNMINNQNHILERGLNSPNGDDTQYTGLSNQPTRYTTKIEEPYTMNTTNMSSFTDGNNKNKNNINKIIFPEANKYQVLIYIKIIGDHCEKGKRNSAELIKEFIINYDRKYISLGTDKKLKLYNKNFKEEKILYNSDSMKETIHSFEPIYNEENLEFIACTNKEIFTYSDKYKEKVEKIICNSVIYYKNINQNSILLQEKKFILAGRNGVIIFIKPKEGEKREEKLNFSENNRNINFRGLIQIDNSNMIAITSNKVLQEGKDILIIYDLGKEKDNELFKINNYSFIASTNGMLVYKIKYEYKIKEEKTQENGNKSKEEKYLLCACKQYFNEQNKQNLQNEQNVQNELNEQNLQNELNEKNEKYENKNGILLIKIIENDNNDNNKFEFIPNFYETNDFEVYCFCPISKEDKNIINDNNFGGKTNFFLVGGFDKVKREGKIKLFQIIRNDKPKIRFLQDIEFEFEERFIQGENNDIKKRKENSMIKNSSTDEQQNNNNDNKNSKNKNEENNKINNKKNNGKEINDKKNDENNNDNKNSNIKENNNRTDNKNSGDINKKENKSKKIESVESINSNHPESKKETKYNEEKREKTKYFNGAITSIIQSTCYGNILASCSDGKIYLLSKPNLDQYIK